MSKAFMTSLAKLKQIEGGYSDHPSDTGGKTNFGITEAVARAFGYKGEMRDMTYATAAAIYKARYWDLLRLDEIAEISWPVADELFDSAVNCGQATAGKWLQRALNSFNQRGIVYGDLTVDGLIGRMTVNAFKELMNLRGAQSEVVMLRALNAQQGVYYLSIAESRVQNEDFTFGWFSHRVI